MQASLLQTWQWMQDVETSRHANTHKDTHVANTKTDIDNTSKETDRRTQTLPIQKKYRRQEHNEYIVQIKKIRMLQIQKTRTIQARAE